MITPKPQSKDHVFEARATAEFARLRRVQAELEVETGQLAFVGLSVVSQSLGRREFPLLEN